MEVVGEAENGREAAEKAKSLRPDVTIAVTDACGNSSTASATVTVPHNQ